MKISLMLKILRACLHYVPIREGHHTSLIGITNLYYCNLKFVNIPMDSNFVQAQLIVISLLLNMTIAP
jgi:hypothetical protein